MDGQLDQTLFGFTPPLASSDWEEQSVMPDNAQEGIA
jgi:hypothetical protein